jgi:ketosteroid isomerase-like protein
MKRLSFLLLLLLTGIGIRAQDASVEATVRALDQQTVQAVLIKDTMTLLKLWAPDFTVNNPMNEIAKGGRNTLDRPVMNQPAYASFVRNVEHVMVKGDVVLLMGNEVVVTKGTDAAPGRTINRRFTNIWQKQGADWKLIARHANEICAAR